MDILHIFDENEKVEPGQGSAALAAYETATGLAERGHDVTVIGRKWAGTPAHEAKNGVTFRRYNLHFCPDVPKQESGRPRNLIQTPGGAVQFVLDRTELGLKALNNIRTQDYDVIYVYSPFAANVVAALGRNARDKIVYRQHIGEIDMRLGLVPKEQRPFVLRYFLPDIYLMKRAGLTILPNKRLEQKITSQTPVEESTTTTIPHGVDINEFHPDMDANNMRERLGLDDQNTQILYSSPLIPRKGQASVVEAMNRIVNDNGYEDINFILKTRYTDEEYSEKIQNMIDSYELADYIDIVNADFSIDEMKQLYATADIWVHPAIEDSGAYSALEPLASGLPVIGSDIGVINEMVDDGKNGFIVETNSAAAFAEKIEKVAANPNLAKRMGDASRSIAVEKFGWDVIIDDHIKSFNNYIL